MFSLKYASVNPFFKTNNAEKKIIKNNSHSGVISLTKESFRQFWRYFPFVRKTTPEYYNLAFFLRNFLRRYNLEPIMPIQIKYSIRNLIRNNYKVDYKQIH